MFVLIYPFTSQIFCIIMTSCKDLLITKKIEMTFYSMMESISHLGKIARTSAKSENPNTFFVRFCLAFVIVLKSEKRSDKYSSFSQGL